jgi:hypothetical protein
MCDDVRACRLRMLYRPGGELYSATQGKQRYHSNSKQHTATGSCMLQDVIQHQLVTVQS